MATRWSLAVVVVAGIALAGVLAGCAETASLAQLPDSAKLPQKVLTKDEQTRTMNDMIEKAQSHQVEAAKQIEKAK